MKHAEEHFGSENGSTDFYRLKPYTTIFSQGVYELVDKTGSFWLIEKICIHQTNEKVSCEEYQRWQLFRTKHWCFVLIMSAPDKPLLVIEDIAMSDFQYDSAVLLMVNNCLFLPKEHFLYPQHYSSSFHNI